MTDENMPDQLPLKVRSHLLSANFCRRKPIIATVITVILRVLLEAEKFAHVDFIWSHELVWFFGFGNTHWFESDF